MQIIDWSSISEDQFQKLCISLLFREGYRNIVSLGTRGVKEEGRDAIEETLIGESKENRTIVFQFKRWTINYSDADLKRKIKKELDNKIIPSGKKVDEYLLVTCHPLEKLNKWFFDELSEYPFSIRYFDKTWLELRLESDSQDLRRNYFGVDIERHSYQSLIQTCNEQTAKAIQTVGEKYISSLYVKRPIENEIDEFLKSDKSCFLIVDRSGQGKTNLLCHLAEKFRDEMPVILVFGSKTITAEHDLAMHITNELGYSTLPGTRWQSGLDDLIRISQKTEINTLVLIDGISENDSIVKMKNTLREVLEKYGDKKNIKFIFTCRDTFWSRFRADFPDRYVYKSKIQIKMNENNKSSEIAQFIGDWSDEELYAATLRYSEYFNVTFTLSDGARKHCKYPLLLRLFCETYSNTNIGYISVMPVRKVFNEYFDKKVHKIADYFGENFSPDRIRTGILKIREEMWLHQDSSSLRLDEIEVIFEDFNLLPLDLIINRMCDEGIFLKNSINKYDYINFAFDELSDYFLFLVFSEQYLQKYTSDIERIDHACRILNEDNQREKMFAEKYLVFLARNTEDDNTLSYLINKTLKLDLSLFSQCVWQRAMIDDSSNSTDSEKVYQFAEKLIYFYEELINGYFSEIKPQVDPFTNELDVLGIKANFSPNIREVSYKYKIIQKGKDIITIEATDQFPTWSLSFDNHKLHDPENGLMISIFRGNYLGYGVLHTLDFEWDSPFRGISLRAPDRVAIHDIWNECVSIIDNHQLVEPFGLLFERARSLSKKMPINLQKIQDVKEFELTARAIGETFTVDSRAKMEFRKNAEEYLYYLTQLKTNVFTEVLPLPDLENVPADSPVQFSYSEKNLANYLQKLFIEFLSMYTKVISKNFKGISQYFNLYRQLPLSILFIVNVPRTYVRIFILPEEADADATSRCLILKPENGNNFEAAELRVGNDEPFEEAVRNGLSQLNKVGRLITPIDVLMPMEEFFVENPINNLTTNWIKFELAQLLGVPFNWPS